MNLRSTYLEDTKTFVRENLSTIVKEYADWQKTDKLCEGKYREAAQRLSTITCIGQYGKNTYVSGRLNIVESIMLDCLLKEHLNRAGYLGENI